MEKARLNLLVIGDLPIAQVLPVLGAFAWNVAICVGPDSEQMHDAVDDWSWDNGENAPMTTWHDDGTADDIMSLIWPLADETDSITVLPGPPGALESELIQALHDLFGAEMIRIVAPALPVESHIKK
ncbi:hypothetical protein IGB42_04163 [Andreprevotia sp. IGB-42]|uniref:hypothetical protein n=1 Tax=Andreprevotia sp. IGB-42 TaxID=2497473 RepID=UPI00135733DD|nr:hypothetical protein [Andreprevotia sp. IGB-42]KAF0811397.1 hypothetical protein IGB42_04163 [Andreprevotia sp. IGB-42]